MMNELLHRPGRVFALSALTIFVSLFLNGSLFRMWSLHRDSNILSQKSQETRESTETLKRQVQLAKDPDFIERQAIERLDMANEGDLIFVFSDSELEFVEKNGEND